MAVLGIEELHENCCPFAPESTSIGSKMDILKYLCENKCPWNLKTTSIAAKVGRLVILTYLHKNGCSLKRESTSMAAKKGHLDILMKYLHENDCPWDSKAIGIIFFFFSFFFFQRLSSRDCSKRYSKISTSKRLSIWVFPF
jgi:membrane-associated PAP2 superfamily phosphatase